MATAQTSAAMTTDSIKLIDEKDGWGTGFDFAE